MKTPGLHSPEDANTILQTHTRRHYRAGILMALPIAGGLLLTTQLSASLSEIVMSVASALGLTIGVSVIPDSFRSRRGSLATAYCLVAAMWTLALLVTLLKLAG